VPWVLVRNGCIRHCRFQVSSGCNWPVNCPFSTSPPPSFYSFWSVFLHPIFLLLTLFFLCHALLASSVLCCIRLPAQSGILPYLPLHENVEVTMPPSVPWLFSMFVAEDACFLWHCVGMDISMAFLGFQHSEFYGFCISCHSIYVEELYHRAGFEAKKRKQMHIEVC
jgi:hypothetical protein